MLVTLVIIYGPEGGPLNFPTQVTVEAPSEADVTNAMVEEAVRQRLAYHGIAQIPGGEITFGYFPAPH